MLFMYIHVYNMCPQIETDVGQCRPLTTIYLNAYDVVCNEAVDGLVG